MLRCLSKFPRISSFISGRPTSGPARFASGGGAGGSNPGSKLPRPDSIGMRSKKEDPTQNKGPVSWVNLGVTGVVVMSMVKSIMSGFAMTNKTTSSQGPLSFPDRSSPTSPTSPTSLTSLISLTSLTCVWNLPCFHPLLIFS